MLLAVAVVLFRSFIAEGYMISTGSMAPCLLGYHRRIVCPDCAYSFSRGTRHDIDESILADGVRDGADFGVSPEQATVCPNCGFDDIDIHLVPRNEGDQLLVQKCFYQFCRPKRWEVVVFRHPDDAEQAYVKRVVGLPSEEVQIVDGDVVVNGVLQRKPLSVQRNIRISVYDNDFAPRDESWEPRWAPTDPDSPWRVEGRAFQYDEAPGQASGNDPVQWLEYRHWIRTGGSHRTSVPLRQWPEDAPSPAALVPTAVRFDPELRQLSCIGVLDEREAARLLTASGDAQFQHAVRELSAQSHLGVVTDNYGYNHPQAATPPFHVPDLMVEATIHSRTRTGRLCIRLHDGWQWFDVVFDLDEQRVRLFSRNSPQPLRTASFPRHAFAEPAVVEMSLFDRQVVVAVDGQEVFAPLRYAAADQPRIPSRGPIRIGASGGRFRIEHLRLYRDVYYTPKQGDVPRDRYVVGPDELFVLGDNSPVSVDSRLWDSTTIPVRLLIGKPFVVHLPSKQERVEIGEQVHHIRIPDLSRVRYIR